MGTINKRFQYVWYGTCDQSECNDFIFADNMELLQNKVESISGFNETGDGIETFNVSTSTGTQGFNRMRCGTMYAIVTKPTTTAAGTEVSIPNMEPAGTESVGVGYKISFDCSTIKQEPTPTPTPTVVSCAPATHEEITISGISHTHGVHTFYNFGTGDTVGINFNELNTTTAMGDSIQLVIPTVEGSSFFTLTEVGLTTANTEIYWHRGESCWVGQASNQLPQTGGMYVVNMSLLWGTAPTPAPTPESCIPSTHEEIISSGLNHPHGVHTFYNFQSGDKVGIDFGEFNTTTAMGDSIALRIAGVEGSSFFTLTEVGLTTSNATIWWERSGACYRGIVSNTNSVEGGMYIVNMELVSGEPETQTPVPVAPTQTPVPVAPTQTPVPVQDCCTAGYVKVSTDGNTSNEQVWTIVPEGQTANIGAFIWKGFDDGGEICFDATDNPSTTTINEFAPTIYGLKDGVLVGTVKKTMVEGSTTMHYIDNNGVCYDGVYGADTYMHNGNSLTAINFVKRS